jgi:hypothetical protein
VGGNRFVYASVARLAVLKFVNYMNASADVLALASIEVPINGIPDGGCIVVKYVPTSEFPAAPLPVFNPCISVVCCALVCALSNAAWVGAERLADGRVCGNPSGRV